MSTQHPTNPYVAGAALREEQGFFGRRDTLGRVERELRNPSTSALVLLGQRRIGKTSLLMRLEHTLPVQTFFPVYFDLQDQAERPLAQVLADLADTAAEKAALDVPSPDAFDDAGRFFQRVFLPRLCQTLGEECRPVFLLDEFDTLNQLNGFGSPEATAARALFPLLRRVMGEDPRPAFVFVVGRRAQDLSLDFTATFKTALVQEVWVLDRASARELVLQAEANHTLGFTDRAVERILSLTSCHPYLTQLLCQRVWERAYELDSDGLPLIDVPAVEAAVCDALVAGGQAMVWIWNGLGPAEKIYAAALAEIAGEAMAARKEHVVEVLEGRAARLRIRDVELAPRDLVKRRVLDLAGDQGHRFTLELFRRWVRENRPLGDVKDELDRVEPVAERLYGVGKDFFGQRQWEKAVRYFQDALAIYPNHFRARLHLGEALLELGQPEAAVVELEKAHALDQDEAGFALARAVAQARAPADVQKLLVDDEQGRAHLGTREVHLSPLEYLVLRYLGERAGRVVSKEALSFAVQACEGHEQASVDAAVYRLRKKLGESGRDPIYLETRRGQGYILHNVTFIPRGDSAGGDPVR